MKPEEAILFAKTIMDDSKKPAKLMKGSRALPAIGIPALGITIPGAAIAAAAAAAAAAAGAAGVGALGLGALGAGALGAGALGVGALGAGALGAGAMGAGTLLGAGTLGAGAALGVGTIGAGALGAGALGTGALGAGVGLPIANEIIKRSTGTDIAGGIINAGLNFADDIDNFVNNAIDKVGDIFAPTPAEPPTIINNNYYPYGPWGYGPAVHSTTT